MYDSMTIANTKMDSKPVALIQLTLITNLISLSRERMQNEGKNDVPAQKHQVESV